MADKQTELEYWTSLRERLTPEAVAGIDFDELDHQIEKLINRLEQTTESLSELTILRQEYERRLAGMIKAIAVAGKSRSALESAQAQIEQLSSANADELLKQYRAMSARFRDLFPGSLGFQRQLNRRSDPVRNGNQFK